MSARVSLFFLSFFLASPIYFKFMTKKLFMTKFTNYGRNDGWKTIVKV